MSSSHEFRPNWASAPGATIADILDERKIALVHFAKQIGQTPEGTSDLLEGVPRSQLGLRDDSSKFLEHPSDSGYPATSSIVRISPDCMRQIRNGWQVCQSAT